MLLTFAIFLLCFGFLAEKEGKNNDGAGKYLSVTFSVSFFSSELITKGYANASISGGGTGPFGGAFFFAFFAPLRPPGVGKRKGKKFSIEKRVASVFLKRLKKTYLIASFFLGLRAVAGKRVI